MSRLAALLGIVLMNAWVWPLVVIYSISCILLAPLLMVAWKLVTRWPLERIMRHMIWVYGKGVLLLMWPFASFRCEGLRQIRTPCIIVANHLSFLDTYLLAKLGVWDVRICLRSWPFRMYWYALFMRLARYLDLEGSDWEDVLETTQESFARGEGVMVFPEGHRSRDGELGRFYSGAFRLSAETGCPIFALCIAGTDELLPPTRWWLKPARVTIRAIGPFKADSSDGGRDHTLLRKQVKLEIAAQLAQMRQGSAA